jgi:Carboxypeptidase regulatory-like domain
VSLIGLSTMSSGQILRAKAQESETAYFPLVLNLFDATPGIVEGQVFDASMPDTVLAGAAVCFNGSLCTTTDQEGRYSLEPIPMGTQQFSASMEGYYPVQSTVTAVAGSSAVLNFALSPEVSESYDAKFRIVLTWDPTPFWTDPQQPDIKVGNDLDAHLWIDATLDAHISQEDKADCTLNPYACLEADELHGFGPETIVISELKNDGTYYYGVLNFNAAFPFVPQISHSSATVQIYDHNGLLKEFHVPEAGDGELWYVFSMDGEGNISETNCITALPEGGSIPQCP